MQDRWDECNATDSYTFFTAGGTIYDFLKKKKKIAFESLKALSPLTLSGYTFMGFPCLNWAVILREKLNYLLVVLDCITYQKELKQLLD